MARKKGDEDTGEVFYVGLSDPQEMRRNVLESMRDTILILKTYDHLCVRRAAKVEKILALKHVLEEIDALLNKIRRRLPKTRMRTGTAESAATTQRSTTRSSSTATLNEISRLENELAAIEDKLGKL